MYSYYKLYFNHFKVQKCPYGAEKLTFDCCDYYDEKRDDANCSFEQYDIEIEGKTAEEVFTQIVEKWKELSHNAREELILAVNNYLPKDASKSRVDICSSNIEKITMTNADLVPGMGLRDYGITFRDGSYIELRF